MRAPSCRRRIIRNASSVLMESLETRTLCSATMTMVLPHQLGNQSSRPVIHHAATVTPKKTTPPTTNSSTHKSPVKPTAPTKTTTSSTVATTPVTTANTAGATASIVGRYVYYGATPYFGDVQASDKSTLLPNGTATSANVTSYVNGINEIAIDVANAAPSYSASDFTFRVGTAGSPYNWAAAPAPTSVTVAPGAGVGGSTRVFVRWANGAIKNEWLQATFNPAADTFYLGNLVGNTGDFQVTSADQAAVRANHTSPFSPAAVTNPYDFLRNGKVDATDELIARAANGTSLPVLTAPPVPVTAPSYDWHTQVINGVLNLWAPNPSDFGSTFAVTDPTALFGPTGVPSVQAVHQGPIADCYLFAAGGSLANMNPARIEALVQNDPSGGWSVTFQYYNSTTGQYSPVVIHTDDELSSSMQTVADNQVWPLVIEKAYAAFRSWNGTSSQNTMASLNWGYGGTALSALNDANSTIYYSSMTQQAFYSTLQNDLAAGLPVLFQTSATAPTMVQSHVYIITGVSTDASGTMWVTTYNPWGFYDTRTESDLLNNGIGTISVGTH